MADQRDHGAGDICVIIAIGISQLMMRSQITSLQEYHDQYKKSVEDPVSFWADQAGDFEWDKPWSSVLEADMYSGHNKWFLDGKLNITINCLDRHLKTWRKKTSPPTHKPAW